MHLDQKQLVELLRGQLSEETAGEAMGHLVFCDDCTVRLEALQQIQGDFDGSWDELTNYLSSSDIEETSVTSESESRDIGSKQSLRFAVRLLIDGSARIAAVGAQFVSEMTTSNLTRSLDFGLAASGVGAPEYSAEVEQMQREAADLCGQGDVDGAREKLRNAAEIEPDAVEVGIIKGDTLDGVPVEVFADAVERTVTIIGRFKGDIIDSSTNQPGVTALLLESDGTLLQKTDFVPVEGADYFVAKFTDVADGDWIVGLE